MNERILVTAALPYANGPLHFGHIAGAYLPADCYVRFKRLIGSDVLYICGSDEYGIAITLSAEIAGKTPKEHVDHFHQVISAFFQKLDISFDHFSRTTAEGHAETVQEFFLDLYKNGYIEERVTDQLYSEKDRRFLADRYVIGTCKKCGFEEARGDECPKCGHSYEATDLLHPRSKITGAPLILKPTKHYFLRFDLFREQLQEWLAKKNWKANVLQFAKNYIEDLKPRAITRDSNWGVSIPLEETEGKVFYVWFDAPIGYISATKEWAKKVKKEEKAWEAYWLDPKTKQVQFLGKDNIPFHAIFFPAMIMGQNKPYHLVDDLPANEFYNLEGKKFSKSGGWLIDLEDFFKKFSTDQIRYAIAANAPETQDAEFSWKDFERKCNGDLVGKYGNFVNRVLVFAKNNCQGEIPPYGDLFSQDETFLEKVALLVKEISEAYDQFHLRRASQLVMQLASEGNVYFDQKKPWEGVKESTLRKEMETTIACSLHALLALAVVSYPIIPETAERLWKLLGFTAPLSQGRWEELIHRGLPHKKLHPHPTLLFQKIEEALIEEEMAKLKKAEVQGERIQEYLPLKELISFDQFQKIDLRVGSILSAEKIAKSKKLLKLEVDLGFERRTIVSGIAESFPNPELLIGKKGIFVVNLMPVTLMGVESQGMLLAIGTSPFLKLPLVEEGAPGEVIG